MMLRNRGRLRYVRRILPLGGRARTRSEWVREAMDPAIEERIRLRAYQIWEEEGRPAGRDVEHWIRAVLELARDGSIRLMPGGVLQTDGVAGDEARGGSS
jgi:hypothetical protein